MQPYCNLLAVALFDPEPPSGIARLGALFFSSQVWEIPQSGWSAATATE
jgi:hypothetical protein